MKQILNPTLDDLRLECVLMQAWKKTSSYLRTHSWYADTLGIDYQSLRIPTFLAEIQEAIDSYATWTPELLELVPAPKTQRWYFDDSGNWIPRPNQDYQKKLRPLAHVGLRDQVVATAIMLCLADRIETRMSDPRLSIDSDENRRRVLAYGHRLLCDDSEDGGLRHRWGSSKLYRQYFEDYQTFLRRPRVVAGNLDSDAPEFEVAIVKTDLSKFYDRVHPDLLRQKIEELRREGDDTRFFEFAGRVFDWRWADTTRASRHSRDHGLDGFMNVALPQGLVASGFFANVVMQDFETRLRDAIGHVIDEALGITLLDAAYYVDDFHLVVQIPRSKPGLPESEVGDALCVWFQRQLDTTAPGLAVEQAKTTVTVEGRDRRFLVPQSRAAQRIQSDVSGVFDMLHGTELIGAIEGFFHTQKRYSTEREPEEVGRTGLLVGLSDMRDETAARFAAGRFRRTFRSLRPILQNDSQDIVREVAHTEEEPNDEGSEHSLVLSKVQLDERAKLFAALLIDEWTLNPSNVRLLRVALDMYPDHQFLEEVLRVLNPGWVPDGSRGARREIRLYCLAELFRAGAIETGMVSDDECLPQGIDVERYHQRLLREAQSIFNQFVSSQSSNSRLPWYLMQQVFLYIAARDAFSEGLNQLGAKGGPSLALYRRFAKFVSGDWPAGLDERSSFLVIARTGFALDGLVDRIAQQGVSPEFLSRVEACSPGTATALWEAARPEAGNALTQLAERLGLQPRPTADTAVSLPDLARRELNPFFTEPNLLHLAKWLFGLPADTFDTPLTPWQIECGLMSDDQGDQFGRIDPDTFRIRRSVSTGARLFAPPEWCETPQERQRYQIGALLRFAIRGTTDFFAGAPSSVRNVAPRYARSISHWEQQRYSGFQGRSAFGPPWLPISSFMEDLLYDLLRWPGSGIWSPGRSLIETKAAVESRENALTERHGDHSGAIFLEQSAPHLYRPKHATSWQRLLRIGVVQTVIPDLEDYCNYATAPDLSGDPAFRRRHRAHLVAALEGVNQMRRLRDTHRDVAADDGQTIDLLVFPELAVHPDDVRPLLVPFARKYRCILLFGMVYHTEPRLAGSPLINSCQWLIPELTKTRGFQLRDVEQGKLHLIESEQSLKPAPLGFRPAQWLVEYEWSSDPDLRPLTITASVCYDATDLTLVADLRSRSDLYIICALNRDVGTFDRMSAALHYHMYQGVLLVNNGQFGGSSFFMPFDKPFHRQVFHFHGQPQAAIAFAEISPEKLVNRPNPYAALPDGTWKTPPAGW
ncbi:MAG: RNA-directed DNA polymerase [Gemmatimonadota bacterium]|nr:RNA-directed DNA polymerase [Gemmatimonadota bacterium]